MKNPLRASINTLMRLLVSDRFDKLEPAERAALRYLVDYCNVYRKDLDLMQIDAAERKENR